MLEHITRAFYYFEVHFLYASIVWFAAWALTSIPRGSATTKCWIWVATSRNFILPMGAALDKFWAGPERQNVVERRGLPCDHRSIQK